METQKEEKRIWEWMNFHFFFFFALHFDLHSIDRIQFIHGSFCEKRELDRGFSSAGWASLVKIVKFTEIEEDWSGPISRIQPAYGLLFIFSWLDFFFSFSPNFRVPRCWLVNFHWTNLIGFLILSPPRSQFVHARYKKKASLEGLQNSTETGWGAQKRILCG